MAGNGHRFEGGVGIKAPAISKGLQRCFARSREQQGQMLVLLAVSIVAMCAAGAFVMDVGSWFRAHRATQAVADASALAGAQELPVNTSGATTVARSNRRRMVAEYADQFDELPAHGHDHDTGQAAARDPLEGARHLVRQRGCGLRRARIQPRLGEVRRAVRSRRTEPMLNDCGGPCYGSGNPTTLDLLKIGPGSFKIINIDGSQGGIGPSTLADWINGGLSGTMDVGWYWGDPGAKFNSRR